VINHLDCLEEAHGKRFSHSFYGFVFLQRSEHLLGPVARNEAGAALLCFSPKRRAASVAVGRAVHAWIHHLLILIFQSV